MASKKTESKKNEKTDKSEKALAAEKEQFVKLQVRFTAFNEYWIFSGRVFIYLFIGVFSFLFQQYIKAI